MTRFHYWEKNYHSIGLCPTSIACSCNHMDSGMVSTSAKKITRALRFVVNSQVTGMQAGVTFTLQAHNGTLRLTVVECGTYIEDLDIELHGGASWLYQW